MTVSKKSSNVHQWWYVQNLVAGIDATPTQKCLLFMIHRHTNARAGYAWVSQRTLSFEMCVDLSTIERNFRWAKKLGVVGVRLIRTGKTDQHNEFWLDVERLKELQRPDQHPAPTPGGTDKDPASVPGGDPAPTPGGDPSTSSPRARQSGSTGARESTVLGPGTSAGEGSELEQLENKSENKGAVSSLRSPAEAPPLSPEIEIEKQKLVDRFALILRSEKVEKGNDLGGINRVNRWFDLFRKDANALSANWNEIQMLWRRVLQTVFPAPAPPQPKPVPKPEPVPVSNVDMSDARALRGYLWKRSRAFYAYAYKFGWTPDDYYAPNYLRDFLRSFNVKTPDKLSAQQFAVAWRRLEQGPPKPN